MTNTERRLAGHVDELTLSVTVRPHINHILTNLTNRVVGNETERTCIKNSVRGATDSHGSLYAAPYWIYRRSKHVWHLVDDPLLAEIYILKGYASPMERKSGSDQGEGRNGRRFIHQSWSFGSTCFILLISPLVRISLDGGNSACKSYPAGYSDIKPTIPTSWNIIDLAH